MVLLSAIVSASLNVISSHLACIPFSHAVVFSEFVIGRLRRVLAASRALLQEVRARYIAVNSIFYWERDTS